MRISGNLRVVRFRRSSHKKKKKKKSLASKVYDGVKKVMMGGTVLVMATFFT